MYTITTIKRAFIQPAAPANLPEGALWILLNAGGSAEARLKVAPGIRLMCLAQAGEEILAWLGDTLELTSPGQYALVLRMLPGDR